MEYINIKDSTPKLFKFIKYIDENNDIGYAYLYDKINNTFIWYCIFTDRPLNIKVVKWKYYLENIK